jgi:hypothetical protein
MVSSVWSKGGEGGSPPATLAPAPIGPAGRVRLGSGGRARSGLFLPLPTRSSQRLIRLVQATSSNPSQRGDSGQGAVGFSDPLGNRRCYHRPSRVAARVESPIHDAKHGGQGFCRGQSRYLCSIPRFLLNPPCGPTRRFSSSAGGLKYSHRTTRLWRGQRGSEERRRFGGAGIIVHRSLIVRSRASDASLWLGLHAASQVPEPRSRDIRNGKRRNVARHVSPPGRTPRHRSCTQPPHTRPTRQQALQGHYLPCGKISRTPPPILYGRSRGFCGCSSQTTLGDEEYHRKSETGRHWAKLAAYPSVRRRRRV